MSMELLKSARDAARAGAEVLRGMWGRQLNVECKGRADYVTEADRGSEAAILQVIRKRHPGHLILAEESASGWSRESMRTDEVQWVVDPLDGTTNFIHGIPQVAVSVAALRQGRPIVGVVLDVTRKEEFSALKGQGAWLDGRPMAVSALTNLQDAVLFTGFPFKRKHLLEDYLALFKDLMQEISGIRRPGAAALDLAWVAAGRCEGFWELGLSPWDLSAGALLISEAGGKISDFSGGSEHLWSGEVAAGNPVVHKWLRQKCARRFPKAPGENIL